MKIQHNQQGSMALVAIVALGVIVAVGVVGYRISHTNDTPLAANAPVTTSTKAPATVKTTADLKKASAALDTTPIDGDVNPNQLDSDLSAIL